MGGWMGGVADRGIKGWMNEWWGLWAVEVRGLLFLPKGSRIVLSRPQTVVSPSYKWLFL